MELGVSDREMRKKELMDLADMVDGMCCKVGVEYEWGFELESSGWKVLYSSGWSSGRVEERCWQSG